MRFFRHLVVDTGAGHVAGGVFVPGTGGRLRLEEFALETRVTDPSLEPGWLERTAQALASVSSRRSLRGPAALVVPGHLTLTKFIKTPAVTPGQQAKVIQFEAAQNIPYPLDAVAWDHLVVAGDEPDLEIMLTAVKREVMENLCAAAEAAGFPVQRAASSCLALYRAFQFNYPQVTAPVLVVDIGARSTNLLLIGPGGRFFARTFLVAGNAVTAGIAEELQLDFARAEALKLQPPDDLPEESPAAAARRRAGRNFLSRLQLEILRAAGNFSWRTGATAPAGIYLTGGGSLLPGLAPALAEKFRLPVERYDPLRNLELSERACAAGAASATHLLANLVGLAAPTAEAAKSEPGLLPPAARAARASRRRQPRLLASATLLALALLPPLWHYHRLAGLEQERTAEINSRMRPMQATAERNAANLEKIAAARRQLTILQGLAAARSTWIDFLADLQARLDGIGDVWLDRLAVLRPSAANLPDARGGQTPSGTALRLLLSGRLLDPRHPAAKVSADSYARVKELLAGFTGSPYVAGIEDERFDNARPGLLRFDFILVVNPQHPL